MEVDSVPSSSTLSTSQQSMSHSKKPKRPQHKNHPPSDALPGVQKIKAALRQTRRLLARDTLAANVRVSTERRLKSLEGDLARAEQVRLERTMATRYHKVKFFERRKLTRRIAQTKKQLAEAAKPKERKKLEAALAELRVDLNYVLHYPKTKKYIALFPPEVRQGRDAKSEEDATKTETDRQREELRQWVRTQMDSGVFSVEPDVELETADRKRPSAELPSSFQRMTRKTGDGSQTSTSQHKRAGERGVADDEFFAASDEESGDDHISEVEED